MNLKSLEKILECGWGPDTSSDTGWRRDNPAYGQSAVTALFLEKHYGGIILWANIELPDGEKASHYWNKISDQEIDLTRKQFPEGTIIPPGIDMEERKKKDQRLINYNSNKEYILSHENTVKRYKILEERIENVYHF